MSEECPCGWLLGAQEFVWISCQECGQQALVVLTHGYPHEARVAEHRSPDGAAILIGCRLDGAVLARQGQTGWSANPGRGVGPAVT